MHIQVSPVVLFSILDHFSRRAEKDICVIGTLLGYINENGDVEVKNCYPVPHHEKDDAVSVDTNYHSTMLELHQKINQKELIVGW